MSANATRAAQPKKVAAEPSREAPELSDNVPSDLLGAAPDAGQAEHPPYAVAGHLTCRSVADRADSSRQTPAFFHVSFAVEHFLAWLVYEDRYNSLYGEI